MRKLRYKAMAVTVALAVGAFLGAQRLQIIPGPWTKPKAGNTHMTRDQIVDAFSAAIDANPGDYMTYYRRGTQLQKQRRYEEALADLNAAIKLSPTPLSLEELGERVNDSALPETHTLGLVVLIHTTRAEILQLMNRPEEALADLDRALSFDGRKIDTIYTRGQLRALTGRYDEAIADFDVALVFRARRGEISESGLARRHSGLSGDRTPQPCRRCVPDLAGESAFARRCADAATALCRRRTAQRCALCHRSIHDQI